jgi:membrane-associated PAP2 superfamily phosphatase
LRRGLSQGAQSDRSDREAAAKGAGGEGLRNPQQEAAPGHRTRGGFRSSGAGRRFALEFALVVAALLLASIAIRMTDLDLRVARYFYRPGETPAWLGMGRQPWDALYDYGPWPANIVGGVGVIGFIVSLFRTKLRRDRRSFLLLASVLVIGSGLIVNEALKDHWGRPRPRDCVEFGGDRAFLPIGVPGPSGGGNSFPSGHAASGFYFLTLYILWRGRRPRAAALGLVAGLVAGSILSMQRIVVGAHFLSDCVWSAGIIYLTALASERVISARLE